MENSDEENTDIREVIQDITDMLATMTQEERLTWFCQAQYPHPVNFQKEIDGTVYTANAHFNATASESVQEKTERILLKNCAQSEISALKR
ncbi:MAG: transposon-encoded TnpW family protein [Lachnospiraceae bacterium]|nr:transposon-encoded TnpW family protein [Lachnospiraceae bacterium]